MSESSPPRGSSAAHPVDAIVRDVLERLKRGERPTLAECLARHPDLAEPLRAVLPPLLVAPREPAGEEATGPYTTGTTESCRLERLGDYRILRQVGRGGMGIVYEAEQVSLGRHVALKILPAQSLLDPQRVERFTREARAAARLHHTNIVPVYGVGSDQGLHYYVMQFIHGYPLDEVLADLRRLRLPAPGDPPGSASEVASQLLTGHFEPANTAMPPTPVPSSRSGLSDTGRAYWLSVARLGIQVAEALAHAHALGILHRDVKPSNLLLDLHGVVWVTDFGLAKSADSDDLTHTGDIVGTLRYMAPERFHGTADGRSDVYALGLTLYEMLTLRPAFDADDRQQLVRQVMEEEPAIPRKIDPGIPRDLETIVLKAIARDPGQRYRSARDLADDLQRFVDDRPIHARRVTRIERFGRWCRRNPVLAGLATALVLALLVVTVMALVTAGNLSDLARNREEQVRLSEEARREIEGQIARQHIDRATRLIEQGELAEATLWNLAALQADPTRAEQHRLRLGLLLRQCPRPTHLFFHRARIDDTTFSPDGRLLATASEDGLVQVRDWISGKEVCSPLVHPQPVRRIRFSPDGRRLMTVSGTFEEEGSNPERVARMQVQIWDVKTGKASTPMLPHLAAEHDARFTAGGRQVVTCGEGGTWQVWDADTGRPTARKLSPDRVKGRSSLLSPDGRYLLLYSMAPQREDNPWILPGRGPKAPPGDIQVWDVHRGDLRTLVRGTACFPGGTQFSPDGLRLVLVYGGKAHVHDTATGKCRTSFGPTEGSINHVGFSPNGRSVLGYVFLGRGSQAIAWTQVWDAVSGMAVSPVVPTATEGPAPEFGPDSRSILLHDNSRAVVLVQVRNGQVLARLPSSEQAAPGQVLSPDGRYIASAEREGAARIWEVETGRPVSPWLNNQEGIALLRTSPPRRLLEFTPDGSHLVTGGGSTLRLWPVLRPPEVGATILAQGRLDHVFLSGDGKRVGLVADGQVQTANADDGTTCHPPLRLAGQVLGGWFTHDGEFLCLGVDHPSPGLLPTPPGEKQQASRILDTRRGRLLSLQAPAPAGLFPLRSLSPNSPGFRRDGRFLLTTLSLPRTREARIVESTELRAWESATGRQVGPTLLLTDLQAACWSPDGTLVCTITQEPGQVRTSLWAFDPVRGLEKRRDFDPVKTAFPEKVRDPQSWFLLSERARIGFDPEGTEVMIALPTSHRSIDLRLWKTTGGEQLARLTRIEVEQTNGLGRWNLDLSPASRAVLSVVHGKAGSVVQVGHLDSGKILRFPGTRSGPSWIEQATFDPDGRRFLLRGGRIVTLHDAHTGDLLVSPLQHDDPVVTASFSRDGRRILTQTQPLAAMNQMTLPSGRTCCVWDSTTGQPLIPPLRIAPASGTGIGGGGPTLAWNDAGDRLALSESNNRVRILDLAPDPRPTRELARLIEAATGLRINGAGNLQALDGEALERAWQEGPAQPDAERGALVTGSAWHQRILANLNLGMGLDPSFSPHPRREAFTMAWHLDRLLAEKPDDVRLLRDRAQAHGWQRHWDRALTDLNRAITLDRRGDPDLFARRALVLAERGRWKEALADLEKGLVGKSNQDRRLADQALALLYLKVGDVPAYEKTCERMIETLLKERLTPVGLTKVWPCLLRAESRFDWERLATVHPMGHSMRDHVGEQGLFQAGILLRREKYTEVVDLLTPEIDRVPGLRAGQCFVLAMALARLPGQEARAREMLATGVVRMRDSHHSDDETDDQAITPRWIRRLAEEFLRAQAEAVVGAKKGKQ